MNILIAAFGVEHHVSFLQECARAALIFFYGLILVRISGRRTFGRWSALDITVSIILGSMLGRAITGNAPMAGTMGAAAILVGLHALAALAVARYESLARLVEGRSIILVDNGDIDHRARMASMISKADLHEALHQVGIDGEEQIDRVKAMRLEPKCSLTVIKRADQ